MKTKLLVYAILIALLSALPGVAIVRGAHATSTSHPLSEGTTPSLGSFLRADGTLDLSTGYRGNFDARGWRLASGPNEQPRFAPQAAGDEHWIATFYPPGVDNDVQAVAIDSLGNVYVGGLFTHAGDKAMSYITMWDGATWTALGNGLPGAVRALAIDSSNRVYAGGEFNGVYRWNGASWTSQDGPTGQVYALALDGSGNLYAGGVFAATGGNNIAKLEGTSWIALGSGTDGAVNALAVDSSGNVYAGGSFVSPATYVAMWNRTTSLWSNLGSGTNGTVYALAVNGSNVYVGGSFISPGNYIARWDGSAWSDMGGGVSGSVNAIVAGGAHVYAAYSFGLPSYEGVARWDGSAWSGLGEGMDNIVYALALAPGGDLYAGGHFANIGHANGINPAAIDPTEANRLAQWDSSEAIWRPLNSSPGVNGEIKTMTTDGLGNLYIGGEFIQAGGTLARHVAMWNGATWSAFGNGINNTVYALAAVSPTLVYAGGYFSEAGGVSANNIARWNGSAWSDLGAGVNDSVQALALDSAGILYAGGFFHTAGGTAANHIARWNGSWSALGSGVDDVVWALAADSNNHVYAGGYFHTAGGTPAWHIAEWDGSWRALGSGTNGTNDWVDTIVIAGLDDVYAGGIFITAGGAPASRIARWSGGAWNALGSGVDGYVSALARDGQGNLFATGAFAQAGGQNTNYIAQYNTITPTWSMMGSGLPGGQTALAYVGDYLYVGGIMNTAGNKPADNLARWTPNAPTAVRVAALTATSQPGSIRVSWETLSEIDLLGFNVWRSASAQGPYVQLNSTPIPARHETAPGAAYRFDDMSAQPGVTCYYKLEELGGTLATLHGPVSAAAGPVHRLYLPMIGR